MRVIAVCNNKGGVAKSTTTLAMLDYLRDTQDLFHEHPNLRALAIDLDPSTTALTDRTRAMDTAQHTIYDVLTSDDVSLLFNSKVFNSHIRNSGGTFGEGGEYRLPKTIKDDYRNFMIELLGKD